MKHWALDESGNIRRELYTISPTELDEIQATFSIGNEPDWVVAWRNENYPKAILALEPGQVIYIKPEYSIANHFGGKMTFIGFGGSMNALFCRTEDRGGGWIGLEMLVDKDDPGLTGLSRSE